VNFKILYDADLLANLEEKQKKDPLQPDGIAQVIETQFLTQSGKELARDILLNGMGQGSPRG
jgi:hypothetical protein